MCVGVRGDVYDTLSCSCQEHIAKLPTSNCRGRRARRGYVSRRPLRSPRL